MSSELQQAVGHSADAAGLHANVPALLLELQTTLGALAAAVTVATERGRRPFRPSADVPARIGELAYGVYLLADQTGVDLHSEVIATATRLQREAQQKRTAGERDWPFDAH